MAVHRGAPPRDPPRNSPGSPHQTTERKRQVLAGRSPSVVRSIADAVVIKSGEPFLICPPDGQIELDGDHGFGLYHHDTRFLSGYLVSIAGTRPSALAGTAVTGTRMLLELTTPELKLPGGETLGKESLGVRWVRDLDGTAPRLTDKLELRNYSHAAVRVPIDVRLAADFADIFVVRGLRGVRVGSARAPRWDDGRLVFAYAGLDGVTRRLVARMSPAPDVRLDAGARLQLEIAARKTVRVEVTLEIEEDLAPGARPIEHRTRQGGREARGSHQPDSQTTARPAAGGPGWATSVTTDSLSLNTVLARSLDDLETLRGELDGQRYYAAGVPWFATLFGRDSLIAAYMTLAFEPAVAAETLRLLAGRQATGHDAFRDEEPGKILHELRIGELARLGEIPQTPTYSTVDATPLFLDLLAEHARWTGSLDVFRELRPNVERALDWIDGPADLTGRGYTSYASADHGGLVNQGWKDSGDAIVRADGTIATAPISLPEVQGYVYRAKLGLADLYERDGDRDRATRLREEAAALRERFERDFWSADAATYVLALDGQGEPCDVVASNAGQVLWSSIAGTDRAHAVAERLRHDDVFGGWGIRTLSSEAEAYNPIGYHLGTVWPHDNALIAEGFRRYGLDDDALRLFGALVEASTQYPQHRLPECFAGFPRAAFGVPVRYPIACHPQAWAAAAVPHLLVTNLGLVPDAFEHRLRVVRPRLPRFVRRVRFHHLPVGDAHVDLAFERDGGHVRVEVAHRSGDLDVAIEDG